MIDFSHAIHAMEAAIQTTQREGALMIMRIAFMIVAATMCTASGSVFDFWKQKGEPEWVADLAARKQEFPASQYSVGIGSDEATSRRDGRSRKEAEATARDRVAAALQKRFDAAGLEPSTSQAAAHTLAKAARVERIYFDDTTLKWHLLLALEHPIARKQARNHARHILAEQGKSLDQLGKGPLADYLILYPLSSSAKQARAYLDIADTFGALPETQLHDEVTAFTKTIETGLNVSASNITVRVTLNDVTGPEIPAGLTAAFEALLQKRGIKVSATQSTQTLDIEISTATDITLKTLGVYRCTASGMYTLTEGTSTLCATNIKPSKETESSSSSESLSRTRSTEKVLMLIAQHLTATLDGQ
jgi:hypothetical protein